MKYILILFGLIGLTSIMSCQKVDNSVPEPVPEDSIVVSNGFEYFISSDVGGSALVMYNNIDSVGNSVVREDVNPCGFGVNTRFHSYFGYVSDTSRKERISFGLENCVHDTADGFSDSTYFVGSFPIEINDPDLASGFILFIDSDSVLWSSSAGPNGLGAQSSHKFVVTEVTKSYDGISALRVKGNFSGWVYNPGGDSMLVQCNDFFTRAWGY